MSGRVPTLDIVIVNWNSGNLLRACLGSLKNAKTKGFVLNRICVVDNASCDKSIEKLEQLDLPLEVYRNSTNRGFAAACNQGAAGSHADYLLLLNPDTRVFEDSLRAPIRFLEDTTNRSIAIVGVPNVDEHGEVLRTCARFPTPSKMIVSSLGLDRLMPSLFRGYIMKEWDHRDTRAVEHAIGSFFLVRRWVWEELEGMDERFFLYLEDLDFSLRAYRKGYRCWYLSRARVYHKGGGTSEQIKAARLFYSLDSRLLYARKHFHWSGAAAVAMATVLAEPLVRIAWALVRGKGTEFVETLRGYAMLYGGLIWTRRRLR